MNDRIKELAELAAHDTRAIHNNAYWRMQEQMAEDITWRERFAELIVKECVLEAMDAIHHNTSIRTQLYEHFGVK